MGIFGNRNCDCGYYYPSSTDDKCAVCQKPPTDEQRLEYAARKAEIDELSRKQEIAQLGKPKVPNNMNWYKKQYEELKAIFWTEQAARQKWEARAMAMFWAGDNSSLGEVRELGERFTKFLRWEAEQARLEREKINGAQPK